MMAPKVSAKVPSTYIELKRELVGDRAHCAVISIAAITRLPAKQVQEELAKFGRKPRCGTPTHIMREAVESLGFTITQLGRKELREIILTYPGRAINLQNVTTHHPRRFPRAWAKQPDMLLFSSSHVSAFVDGEVKDWAIKHSKQVYMAWLVTPKES